MARQRVRNGKRRNRIKFQPLNKEQVIKLLDSLNIDHSGVNKFNDLKKLLYKEIPDYKGKKSYRNISEHIEDKVIPNRVQNIADDLEPFANYQPPQQQQQLTPTSLMIKDNIDKQLKDTKDFEIDFGTGDRQT